MSEDLEVDLAGNHWKVQGIRPGQGEVEGFHKLPSEYQGTYFNWNQGCVPGDVYTDLHRAGEIDDPYFGRNFGRAKWVMEREWWYLSKFNITEEMQGKRIFLHFEGVDYGCEVWINGNYLGKHEGMFSPFEFDITNYARSEQWYEGCNIVAIKLLPPPRNYRNVAGRKFCFGGDYMPDVVPFGIWRTIKVRATGDLRIKNSRIESEIDGDDANVNIEVHIDNMLFDPKEVVLKAELKGENFESKTITHEIKGRVAPGMDKISFSVPVKQAKLWWPWDMGDQNLYQADFTLLLDGEEQDTRKEVFGIRTIEMAMNPGYEEGEVETPWTFVINGKSSYLRSSCWSGPPSMLYGRNRNSKYDERLEMVKEANINNLRIFGWHPPEVPYFYELCDRLGITVWTNFTFATQAFEATHEFMSGAIHDCTAIVEERRNHPSAIYWMGGEEVFFSDAHVDSDNKFIMEEIGKAVAKVTNVPYGLASPLSGHYGQKLGFKPKESTHANEHYYAAGHMTMEEYYGTLDFCVVPELTAASAPSVEALKKFIPENELWPAGPSWGYHWADLDILKLLNVEVFGELRTDTLEDFVESTQIAQGMIFQYALESLRRKKPKVSAVAFCHFMTHMPDIKWGIIDYYGDKKLSFDYVKRAYQPLVPSLYYEKRRWNAGKEFEGEIHILNDFQNGYDDLQLSWRVIDPQGKIGAEGSACLSIGANSVTVSEKVKWLVSGEDKEMFKVEMTIKDSNGEILSENYHTLLVGDQDEMKEYLAEQHRQVTAKANSYGKSYYRYHEELWDFE